MVQPQSHSLALAAALAQGETSGSCRVTKARSIFNTPHLTGHLQQPTKVWEHLELEEKPSATAGHSALESQEHQGPADPDPARGLGTIPRSAAGGGINTMMDCCLPRLVMGNFLTIFSITHWNSHKRKSEPSSSACSATNLSDKSNSASPFISPPAQPVSPSLLSPWPQKSLAAPSLPGAVSRTLQEQFWVGKGTVGGFAVCSL